MVQLKTNNNTSNNTAIKSCSLLGVDLKVNMSLLGLDKCQQMYSRNKHPVCLGNPVHNVNGISTLRVDIEML